MQRAEVVAIFNENKSDLIKYCKISSNPIAVLLGGQPASGKSYLALKVEDSYPNEHFLKINGDTYRAYHPNHDALIKDTQSYSDETQIFSNVFTGELINEACKNKFNVIIEGTMRNPDVPLNTAKQLKQAGFKVEVYVIATPSLVTELGIYIRYQTEIQAKGVGRLSDITSHNEAVHGLLTSIDSLYETHFIDKIALYNFLAKDKIKDFHCIGGQWDCLTPPSEFIVDTRNAQLKNKQFLSSCIERGEQLIQTIDIGLRSNVLVVLNKLKDIEVQIIG
jgi:hypothetical protein